MGKSDDSFYVRSGSECTFNCRNYSFSGARASIFSFQDPKDDLVAKNVQTLVTMFIALGPHPVLLLSIASEFFLFVLP